MKTAVIGSHRFTDAEEIYECLDKYLPPETDVIVSDGEDGVNRVSCEYARERGIKVVEVPADNEKYGNRARTVRNECITEYADYFIYFWDSAARDYVGMLENIRESEKDFIIISKAELVLSD